MMCLGVFLLRSSFFGTLSFLDFLEGTNSDAKETGTQINGVDQKEERNIPPEKNEETRIRKNEERLRNLQDILKSSNIRIIAVPEGEEEEQKIENL